MPVWVKSHWPKYVEGCQRAGRPADPANWRVAKSIFVADDDRTAEAYAMGPNSPYRYYYNSLVTKLKKNGRAELFKTSRDMPDEAVTTDMVCNELIIHGSPERVADQLLAFRETIGDFGTLLYAGKDWLDRDLGRHSMILRIAMLGTTASTEPIASAATAPRPSSAPIRSASLTSPMPMPCGEISAATNRNPDAPSAASAHSGVGSA